VVVVLVVVVVFVVVVVDVDVVVVVVGVCVVAQGPDWHPGPQWLFDVPHLPSSEQQSDCDAQGSAGPHVLWERMPIWCCWCSSPITTSPFAVTRL
jgi:hypothetical protein